jgi:hypothetical protein
MERGNSLALPGIAWELKYLEDTLLRRLVLEYYDQEHVAIRRYLLLLSVDSETAQEIVQEAFLKLQEHVLAHGDRTNLRAWYTAWRIIWPEMLRRQLMPSRPILCQWPWLMQLGALHRPNRSC